MQNSNFIATPAAEQIKYLLGSVQRPGMDRLMEFLEQSDFYEAPASTQYHSSCPGGLVQHSLNTYQCLLNKMSSPLWSPILQNYHPDSLIIMALFTISARSIFISKVQRIKRSMTRKKSKTQILVK